MITPNTSASGGYLEPVTTDLLPQGQSFEDFIQQVFVGISELPGQLVRPSWQINPPKNPDVTVDWMALAVVEDNPDTFAYVSVNANGNNVFMRMRDFEVKCSFYGPNSQFIMEKVSDGFQIPQNMEVLKTAKMGFRYSNRAMRVPDLVNERWVDRWEMSVFLNRETLRTYPILSVLSVQGTVTAQTAQGTNTIPLKVSTS